VTHCWHFACAGAKCTAARRLSTSLRWCIGDPRYVRPPGTGRYPRRTRTGLFASAPTPTPVHCCAARAPLRVSALWVASGPVAFISLWPRGTLGVLVPTSQLLSPKLLSQESAASRRPGLSKNMRPVMSCAITSGRRLRMSITETYSIRAFRKLLRGGRILRVRR